MYPLKRLICHYGPKLGAFKSGVSLSVLVSIVSGLGWTFFHLKRSPVQGWILGPVMIPLRPELEVGHIMPNLVPAGPQVGSFRAKNKYWCGPRQTRVFPVLNLDPSKK